MKTMKRTFLVGASMFALLSGVSAQVDNAQDFEAYQAGWKKSHNVTEMTPAIYEQMKIDWVQSFIVEPEDRLNGAASAESLGLPSDFPTKKYTGNATADEDAYQLEKALWIENNQERYNQMMATPKPPTKAQLEERRQVLNNQTK